MAEGEERWCVVTGGRGFAARHLVEMLIRSGKWWVRIADLAPDIKLDPYEEEGLLGDALQSGRAVYVSADLRNKSQVVTACQGAEAVFHMAAPDSSINNYQLHFLSMLLLWFTGTRNVIDTCIECKVKRLIYTSSPSVVFDGIHGIYNGDESMLYPDKHNDSYSATKAEAEALVIKSNGKGELLTCCMRPSGIFGPGDKLLVPSLVAAARAGKSKFIIGDGNNMYDFSYVENVAHAHICAEQTLASEGSSAEEAAGKAYFVTNMEPIKFWEFVSLILEGLGYERPRFKIPASVMMPIAYMEEWTYKMLAPYGMCMPQLMPSRIRLLSCNRTFNCSKAKEQLGYTPIVSHKEGLERTVEFYSSLRAEQHTKRSAGTDQPSKASTCLGNGKEEKTRLIALSMGSTWNTAVGILKSLCRGNDWTLFFKVVCSLLILSFHGGMSLHSIFVIGVPFVFIAFYVYERKEEEIDGLFQQALSFALKLKSNAFRNFLTPKHSEKH